MAPPLHPTLTDEKVREMLLAAHGDSAEVLEAELSPGVEKGANFMGEIFRLDGRVRAAGKEKEVHWFIKVSDTWS